MEKTNKELHLLTMQLLSLGDGDISGGGVGTDPALGSLKAKGTHSCSVLD
jgi:hypothetical protein